jgi:DNA-binding CsgD family transcriptional regulator
VVLNALPVAVIIAGERGRILTLSRGAEAILAQADGLGCKRGALCAGTHSEHERLLRLIVDASQTTFGTGLSAGGSMLVSRRPFRKPYSLLVSPAPVRYSIGFRPRPAVVIFISDPETVRPPKDHALCQLFGLTKAEGRLAAFLMQGKSLEDASGYFGVTRNTVRSQLAQILCKTKTHRQSELIHLLLRSTASLNSA